MTEEGGWQRVRGECPAWQPLAQGLACRVRKSGDGCREEALPVRDMRVGLDRIQDGEGVPCGIHGGQAEAREDGLGQELAGGQ